MTPRTLTRRSFLGSLALTASAGLLAACGAASQTTGQATQAATSAAQTTAKPSSASAATTAAPATTSSAAVATTTSAAATTARATTASATASATSSASPKAAASASGTQVELNWWPGWPGTYMNDVANAFMKENPKIKVTPNLIYPDNDKLIAQLAAGTGPDVVSDLGYYNFIERGVVLPIDDLLKTAKIDTKSGDIRESNWNAFFWKGKHYGVPAVDTAGRGALGYNVELVQQAGLDPDKPPETWDDAFVWHQKLTKIDSSGNVQSLGFDPLFSRANATSDGDTWMWPELWGFHYFDVNKMQYNIDRSETSDIYATIQKFYDLIGPTKQAAFLKPFTKSYGAFGAGKQAMGVTYPSGPARVHQVNPTGVYKWTYIPVPSSRKGTTVQAAAGHAQLLLQGSKHVTEGFTLAVFMTQKAACDILFDQVGWVGPSKSWQKTMDLSKFPPDVQAGIRFFNDSLDQAKEVWTPELDPEDEYLGDQWRKIANDVNAHKMDTKTAASQLQFIMTTQLKSQENLFK